VIGFLKKTLQRINLRLKEKYEKTKSYYIRRHKQNLVIEVKPSYAVNSNENQQKFAAAQEYCKKNEQEFRIITENDNHFLKLIQTKIYIGMRQHLNILKSKSNQNQRVILVEGADRTGKTEISQELSRQMEIPYFKNSNDVKAFLKDDDSYFQNVVMYAEPFFTSYLEQSKASVIMDRGYVSELVYSQVFNRPTDLDMLTLIDTFYADIGAFIVHCYRSDYKGIEDDVDPERLNSGTLSYIDDTYRECLNQSACRVIRICVDDHDLERQTTDITRVIEFYERKDS